MKMRRLLLAKQFMMLTVGVRHTGNHLTSLWCRLSKCSLFSSRFHRLTSLHRVNRDIGRGGSCRHVYFLALLLFLRGLISPGLGRLFSRSYSLCLIRYLLSMAVLLSIFASMIIIVKFSLNRLRL